ncbi:enoyl-CoA hydratase/isomerase family protein [Paenactinomyces guangxiensis]|uniref:Enoyl-CoA hydratase n=1 Tax=Paenactinomyces guangxiensis TaxID=1490290 RepID=A0A7W1WRE8_9BACL|nr:enoyl-CoA hydratase [Paenactinomyces guangxiensis]MBA4494697.1 enoyl-CoA hydratase [Paenactinomyces guangxiensis]MBH8591781.1 enoyl-CoA hydratase [Paenactinomyces guangxiensis]
MANEHLLVDIDGQVMTLTLNRPEVLNAFSKEMIFSLQDVLKKAEQDENIRCIVIRGAGRSFSAGGDVKQMGQSSPGEYYEHIGYLNQLIEQMTRLEKPILAVVHGFAAGAGVCLAMACDMIIAAEDSRFALSFAQVGLISDGGGLFFLPRTLGLYRAKELLFTAEPISAAKAESWGMINRVVPAEKLESEAGALARQLAGGPTRVYGKIKRLAHQALTADLADILEAERAAQALMVPSYDHQEGVRAFREKRKPHFKGK